MKEVKINSRTATIVVNPPPEKADKPVITLDLEAKTVTYQQNQKADELYIGVMTVSYTHLTLPTILLV